MSSSTRTDEGGEPVRWVVRDGWADVSSLPPVPAAAWPGWEAGYDNDCERGKRTARVLDALPGYAGLLRRVAADPPGGTEPDPGLWGGGLHVTAPGGHLNCHLDYALHPKLPGKRRAANAVLFCHREWREEWGGKLYFADPLGNPIVWIDPVPGRLVVWENNDMAYHGVFPVRGPAERVTLCVSFLAPARPTDTRRRALFLPTRGLPAPHV